MDWLMILLIWNKGVARIKLLGSKTMVSNDCELQCQEKVDSVAIQETIVF
jgi:hypothetical protein